MLLNAAGRAFRHSGPLVYYRWREKNKDDLLRMTRDEIAAAGELYNHSGTIHSLLHFAWYCGSISTVSGAQQGRTTCDGILRFADLIAGLSKRNSSILRVFDFTGRHGPLTSRFCKVAFLKLYPLVRLIWRDHERLHGISNGCFVVAVVCGVGTAVFALAPRAYTSDMAVGGQECFAGHYCQDNAPKCSSDPACTAKRIACSTDGTTFSSKECKSVIDPMSSLQVHTCTASPCAPDGLMTACQQ